MGNEKKRIVIWGAGTMAEGLANCFDFELAEIIYYVDNDIEKIGKIFQGKSIIAPKELITKDYDFVFISSVIYQKEILEQLKELGVPRDKIISAVVSRLEMARILGFVTEKGLLYFTYIVETSQKKQLNQLFEKNARLEKKLDVITARLGNPFNRSRHLYLKQYYEADAAKFIAEEFIEGPNAPGKTVLFESRAPYFDYVLKNLKYKNGLYLEFGVCSGGSINYISERIENNIIYGFDTFEGLPDEWIPGYGKGSFSKGGTLPKVNSNVRLIQGLFDDTLPGFVQEHLGEKCSLIHIDSDLYSSAKCVLSLLKDNIGSGTTICFDEFAGHIGWRDDEYKAFMEFIEETGYGYRYIAGSFAEHPSRTGERVAIEIL